MARELVFANVDENGVGGGNDGDDSLALVSSSGSINGLFRGDREGGGGGGERTLVEEEEFVAVTKCG